MFFSSKDKYDCFEAIGYSKGFFLTDSSTKPVTKGQVFIDQETSHLFITMKTFGVARLTELNRCLLENLSDPPEKLG
jgi:hypothetical protein